LSIYCKKEGYFIEAAPLAPGEKAEEINLADDSKNPTPTDTAQFFGATFDSVNRKDISKQAETTVTSPEPFPAGPMNPLITKMSIDPEKIKDAISSAIAQLTRASDQVASSVNTATDVSNQLAEESSFQSEQRSSGEEPMDQTEPASESPVKSIVQIDKSASISSDLDANKLDKKVHGKHRTKKVSAADNIPVNPDRTTLSNVAPDNSSSINTPLVDKSSELSTVDHLQQSSADQLPPTSSDAEQFELVKSKSARRKAKKRKHERDHSQLSGKQRRPSQDLSKSSSSNSQKPARKSIAERLADANREKQEAAFPQLQAPSNPASLASKFALLKKSTTSLSTVQATKDSKGNDCIFHVDLMVYFICIYPFFFTQFQHSVLWPIG
jgi:hypothetical protein